MEGLLLGGLGGAKVAGILADGVERLGVRALGGRGLGHGGGRRRRGSLLGLRHGLAALVNRILLEALLTLGGGVGVGVRGDGLGDGLAGGHGLGLGHGILALGDVDGLGDGASLVGGCVDGLGDGAGFGDLGDLGFGHGLLARDFLFGVRHVGVGAALVSAPKLGRPIGSGKRARGVADFSR